MTESKKQNYDYLTEDKPIDGQKYVLLSFISPEGEGLTGVKNCKIRGLKVRGFFNDFEEAKAYSEKLRDTDNKFHIFIGEVGKWLPWDPNPEEAKEENYANEQLNTLMKTHLDNQEKAKKLYNARKDELVQKTLQETENRSNKLKKKKKRRNNKRNILDILKKKENDVNEIQNNIEQESKELNEVRDELNDTKSKLMDTDMELKRLQEEYDKI